MPASQPVTRLPIDWLPAPAQLEISPLNEVQRCWAGMGLSTYLTAQPLQSIEEPEAFRDTYRYLRDEAQNGNAAAWNELGWLWMNGFFLPNDPDLAIRALQIAAQAGCAEAHYNLGTLFGYAADGRIDQELAAQHLKLAAPRLSAAAHALGELYEGRWVTEAPAGTLLPEDQDQAWEWYLRAADAGHVWAALKVAIPQLEGSARSGSLESGLDLLEGAAALTHTAAPAEALMEFYLVTRPGSEEYSQWRDEAIALGSRKARQYLAYERQAARLNKENDA